MQHPLGTDITTVSRNPFVGAAQPRLEPFAAIDQGNGSLDFELESVVLARKVRAADDALAQARYSVRRPERALVLEDFDNARTALADQYNRLTGKAIQRRLDDPRPQSQDSAKTKLPAKKAKLVKTAPTPQPVSVEPDERLKAGTTRLQLSWTNGDVIAWASGFEASAASHDQIRERLQATGAPVAAFEPTADIRLPNGQQVSALRAPVSGTLGWLVTVPGQATHLGDALAPSLKWLGLSAVLAVRLVAQGRFVLQLDRGSLGGGKSKKTRKLDTSPTEWVVRWVPALIDHNELIGLTDSLPGAVPVLDDQKDPRAYTQAVLADLLNAVCTQAAALIDTPAALDRPRTPAECGEAVLAHMDGKPFMLPNQRGYEISRGLQSWAKNVLGASTISLALQLDEPDEYGAWYLQVLSLTKEGAEPVDAAMGSASNSRREQIKKELERLEGLYPVLERTKGHRRGEVILSTDEAWELMTDIGPILSAAGFEMRVPPLSRKRIAPGLKLTSKADANQTSVGARQLTEVSWSATFGDVSLTAAEIRNLASQHRPVVQAHGKWVELSHADLAAAAQALADAEDQTTMTGADMLRRALGLDGVMLEGGISLQGDGWAADLLNSAKNIPTEPDTNPACFFGTLRSYQADAVAWLDFLDAAGLGGCLALDMGLGKTPTVLAHLGTSIKGLGSNVVDDQPARGTSIIIVPPAVVGNWANEARRFTPHLSRLIHHGPNRRSGEDFLQAVRNHDIVITTYGTAVRDIALLEQVEWGKVVLDEAQIIKNPASETAQQLRRLNAYNRIVLTGTPIENGLGDLWALLDFTNPGLVGGRNTFVAQLGATGSDENALQTLNGVLVYRRTKAEASIAEELPDRIDRIEYCSMTPEQIGMYQAVLDQLMADPTTQGTGAAKRGNVLAAITALKQICNHPAAYTNDREPLDGRSGKLTRLGEIADNVWRNGEKMLVFTHFARWGERLADWLSERMGQKIYCYHGGLSRPARDDIVDQFQATPEGTSAAMVLSLKAGGTGLNLTAANHVVLYDRWWNPAVEDQARDRVWRIGQKHTVMAHRLVCPGTVDQRVEEVVEGKRMIADMALPKSSSVGDLDAAGLQRALGIDTDELVQDDTDGPVSEELTSPTTPSETTGSPTGERVLDGTGHSWVLDGTIGGKYSAFAQEEL
ncbi:DEAD/DEAH box helicase [Stomatohabitans albus]|uniref:DEAD/DEAH box helicase n=2 Tax=Stomatohabitans albus TaxID=3110766 RepID=UPI00300C3E93